MGVEIERKYLVVGDGWRRLVRRRQALTDHLIGTFALGKLRLRLCEGEAVVTLKGNRAGIARSEHAFAVAAAEAEAMIAEFAVGPPIEKLRHDVAHGGLLWQIDEYRGALAGLVTADLELPHADHAVDPPAWIGREITGDPRYSSRRLAERLREAPGSPVRLAGG